MKRVIFFMTVGLSLPVLASNFNYQNEALSDSVKTALEQKINRECGSLLDIIESFNLVKSTSNFERIDQGYIDRIWSLEFDFNYAPDYLALTHDKVFLTIREEVENRSGVLQTYIASFRTQYESDGDVICNE